MLNPATMFDSGTAQIPLSLLRRVASDDAFRAQMETDTAAALSQYGLEIDPALLPERVTLPDGAHLEAALSCFDDPEMGDQAGTIRAFHGFFARSSS